MSILQSRAETLINSPESSVNTSKIPTLPDKAYDAVVKSEVDSSETVVLWTKLFKLKSTDFININTEIVPNMITKEEKAMIKERIFFCLACFSLEKSKLRIFFLGFIFSPPYINLITL